MEGPENKDLVTFIRDRLRQDGKIPFGEFMDLALYHPHHGYYNSSREKIGAGGDFYTSPNIHPIFGHLIARQLHQMWKILSQPSPFYVVEMGAGKGLLCGDILSYCQNHLPPFYGSLLYILVEKSLAFQEKQKALLAEFTAQKKIAWLRPENLLRGENPFMGCLLSNELIDSFPVHLVQQEGGRLYEIYVREHENKFTELLNPPSTPALETYLRTYGSPFAEGQRGEVNLRALEWIEGVSRGLERGFVLTIDYGYEARELYHPSRRQGTLLCYFRHTTSPNPYQRIGYQDITSHVNFTALVRKGETVGLEKVGYLEQYKFLIALGLLEDLEELEKKANRYSPADFLKNKLAMKNFLVPGGMGTLFKVLAQAKGVKETKLIGFQDPLSRPIGSVQDST